MKEAEEEKEYGMFTLPNSAHFHFARDTEIEVRCLNRDRRRLASILGTARTSLLS
jgi:hypothetical protein